MELSLNSIQHFIQSYVNIISIVLKADVTVVDKNLVRIAGTNLYEKQIGKTINHAKLYRSVLDTGESNIMIKGVGSASCYQCLRIKECTELADIACPIFYAGQVIGVISIIALTQESQNNLIDNNENYIDFLRYMGSLLESKLIIDVMQLPINLKNEKTALITKTPTKVKFITKDPRIKEILHIIEQTTKSDSTMLITGESGTGKDVLAQVIHQSSKRAAQPMVSLNCAAIPENLIESELFGYEKGAFTGAHRDGQLGQFEMADGGILFLDEIGEMSLSAQTRLLRVLQDKMIRRIGGKTDIPVDVRVICATNQNLLQLVDEKKFRLDLYYRINVIPFHLPPLRERKQDIALLLQEFLTFFNHKFDKNLTISDEALAYLNRYDWPGNVRELKNVVEYLSNIKMNGIIEVKHLPFNIVEAINRTQVNSKKSLKSIIKQQESQLLHSLMSTVHSTEDKKQLANELGISVSSLYRKMAEYKLAQKSVGF